MARMQCRCGEVIWNGQSPNDVQLIVYTDKEWDEIMNCNQLYPWMIPAPRYDIWKCPKCGRIYVYDRENDTPKYVYELA